MASLESPAGEPPAGEAPGGEPPAGRRRTGLDLGAVSGAEFVRLVRNTPARQLDVIMSGPERTRILDEVFGRMPGRFAPDSAEPLSAVVRWYITDRDQPESVYETAIGDGACVVTKGATECAARLTVTVPAVEFLRLAAGATSGEVSLTARRLRLDGDRLLAAALGRCFGVPALQDG